MTWRVLILGVATATLTLTLTLGAGASAEEGPAVDYNRVGGYLAVNGVYAWSHFGGTGAHAGQNLDGNSNAGFAIRLGNRFHPNVAVEFQYEFLASRVATSQDPTTDMELSGSSLTCPVPPGPEASPCQAEFYTHQTTLNFRVYPWASEDDGFFHAIMAGRIQPYALAGMGATIIDTPQGDAVGFVARFGIGFDFYATEHIVLTLEGAYAISPGSAGHGAETTTEALTKGYLELDHLDHVSLGFGAAYRF